MPNLNLKNFAKIKDSDFDIKDITVFTGKPGSGKSYIMKMLYGLYDVFHKYVYENKQIINKLDNLREKIDELLKSEDINKEKILKILSETNQIKKETTFEKDLSNNENINTAYKNIFNAIFSNLEQINNNFEINYLDIKLKYKNKKLTTDLKDDEIFIKSESNIFVETPLILEFKRFMNREEGKTPYHIESLLKILDKDYSFTDEKQDEFIKSFVEKSKSIINGSIEDSGDSFVYKTDKQDFDIINASSGIKSIGLLQYLVTNKALKKGSILFWEEPEVHLHPTWQLKMIDLFVELMDAGVKVIFSTHSPFMTDYLNAKSKKENFRNKISFNLLNEENGIVKNTILDDNSWDKLQNELLDPLEEVMWEYI